MLIFLHQAVVSYGSEQFESSCHLKTHTLFCLCKSTYPVLSLQIHVPRLVSANPRTLSSEIETGRLQKTMPCIQNALIMFVIYEFPGKVDSVL